MWINKPFKDTYPITSKYGLRIHPIEKVSKFHKGVDIGMPEGTPIIAPVDGYFEAANQVNPVNGNLKGYGKYGKLFFKTEQGNNAMLLFGHLSDNEIVKERKVIAGQLLALSGNTGSSTGAHLHLGLFIHDQEAGDYMPVDPEKYINFA